MLRKIIEIEQDKCNGCGLCVDACHEGAIGLVDGVATLLRDDYCDGLGDCLPSCPTNAIHFVEREALAYDEEAVLANIAAKNPILQHKGGCPRSIAKKIERDTTPPETLACGCPGTTSRKIEREKAASVEPSIKTNTSQLNQWPVQIKLVPVNAPYFDDANLLIAADCSAFAYGNFHNDFIKNKVTLIGCPKLDGVDYSEKLTEILKNNAIKSVEIVRMEVPCCGGLVESVKKALIDSGKMIPWSIKIVKTDGNLAE